MSIYSPVKPLHGGPFFGFLPQELSDSLPSQEAGQKVGEIGPDVGTKPVEEGPPPKAEYGASRQRQDGPGNGQATATA